MIIQANGRKLMYTERAPGQSDKNVEAGSK